MIAGYQIILSLIPLYFSYKLEKSIFGPATIGNTIWIISAIFGVAGSKSEPFELGLLAVQIQLLIYTTSCLVGEVITSHNAKKIYLIKSKKSYSTSKWKYLLLLLIINSVLTVILPIYHIGLELSSSNLIENASEELSLNRYAGEGMPIYINAMLGMLYAHCLILGSVIGSKSKLNLYEKITLFIAPISIVAYGVLSTARLTILIGLVFITAGYASTISLYEIKEKKTITQINFKKIMTLLAMLLILIGLFIVAGGLRAGEFNYTLLSSKLLTYTSGIQGLGEWLNQNNQNSISFGAYTFAGPLNLLGITPREIGLIQEYYVLPDGQQSNLYTSLRWIIEDFTIIGSTILISLYGAISGHVWKQIRMSNPSSTSLYSVILTSTLCSPIFSLFAYNNLILAISSFYIMKKFRAIKE